MSLHRENITWQSKDGTWNRGFYDYYPVSPEDDEPWDEEWDVEYTGEFNWVSTGHRSKQSANDAWNGPNPGGGDTVTYHRSTAKQCAALDELAWAFRNPEAAKKKAQRVARAALKTKVAALDLKVDSYVSVAEGNLESYGGLVYTGYLHEDNGWLVLATNPKKPLRVFNTKTGATGPKINNVAKEPEPNAWSPSLRTWR